MNSALVQHRTIDKNGRATTVYRKPDDDGASLRLPPQPPLLATKPTRIDEEDLFSEENQDTYSSGECWRLAAEVIRIGGEHGLDWKLVCISPDYPGMEHAWVHMSVLTPEGELLDIDGLNRLDDQFGNEDYVDARWGYSVQEQHRMWSHADDCDYRIKPKMHEVESAAHFAVLTDDQSVSIHPDAEVTRVAQQLFDWYSEKR